MNSLYKKYLTTVALVWSGCLVAFLLANVLVLAPQRQLKQQLRKELAEKKQMCETVLKLSQQDSQLKLKEQTRQLQLCLKDLLVTSDNSGDLTFDISRIAGEKKVSSFSIKTKDGAGGTAIPNCDYIRENRIDVGFTSGFAQFAAFLNALERHQPVVFVDKFTIVRSDENPSGHQVTMELAVLVRKQREG
jgi:hypothetical protein